MKHIWIFLFLPLIAWGQPIKNDHRTFEQINDSIMREAGMLYKFERSKAASEYYLQDHRKIQRSMGRIFVYEKTDTVYNLIISEKEPNKVLYTYKYADEYHIPIDEDQKERKLDSLESKLIETRDLIIKDIQENYEVQVPCRKCYFNPIFIPFKDSIGGQEVDLYKVYVLIETDEKGVVPLGSDYLFYAQGNGKVFYWLRFNSFQPVPVQYDQEGAQTIEISYPEREPYITPTDIFLFRKYAEILGLEDLVVHSTYLDVYFKYDFGKNMLIAFRR